MHSTGPATHLDGLLSRAISLPLLNNRGPSRPIKLKITLLKVFIPRISVNPPGRSDTWPEFPRKPTNHFQLAPKVVVLDWALAIIVDSDDLPRNLRAIARTIARQCDFNYLPSLTIFSEGRALFFCKSMKESLKALLVTYLRMGTSSIFLNKYSRIVDVIDSNLSAFRGCDFSQRSTLRFLEQRTL